MLLLNVSLVQTHGESVIFELLQLAKKRLQSWSIFSPDLWGTNSIKKEGAAAIIIFKAYFVKSARNIWPTDNNNNNNDNELISRGYCGKIE